MRRPAALFIVGAVVVASDVVMRVFFVDHVSAIAGMPISSASWTLGPLIMLSHLATIVLAPIFVIAATLDTLTRLTLAARARSQPPGSP